MDPIQYIGELAWPGVLGRLAVCLTFVSALTGAYAFFRANRSADASWMRLSRILFGVHAFALLGIVATLLGLMVFHRYEYQYAWNHVSDALPMRYIFSAFWEGQEGSFLLWMFWHMILGAVVVWRNDKQAAIVMAVLLAVQCVIASMLLGIYWGDARIGSNPFLLLRDTMDAPLFSNPRYLDVLEGNGLNPLLQNYWMTIHPPTLFLGFASVTIPFCYALGGLINKDYSNWIKPVLPWAMFSAGILGTGILMGGAWAYEALSFGGYWAWDPVENMSLVPWIVLVGAIHGNLVARKTGYSMRVTITFYLLAFILVLYSTFLTRSGVLGDSSAHAFTQMGLEWQLTGFVVVFALVSLFLLIRNWKYIPAPEKEESVRSREFWMFIGSLILLFSAGLITFTTSIPVYNKLFDFLAGVFNTDLSSLHRTAPIDPIAHYNRFQLWIGAFVALLSAVTQYLRYRAASWDTFMKRFLIHAGISAALAVLLSFVLSFWIHVNAWQYLFLLFCASYGVVANLDYLITFMRGNVRESASALAHLGFSVMLIGIMASGLNKEVISSNVFAQTGLVDGMDPRSHIYLIKGRPMYMNGYWVTYERDTVEGNTRHFEVSYKRTDGGQDTLEKFSLEPNVIFNRRNTKLEATNPSTKRYLDKDIFTYVAALPVEQMDMEAARSINDTMSYAEHLMLPGDTFADEEFTVEMQGLNIYPDHADYAQEPGDLAIQTALSVTSVKTGKTYPAAPILYLRENLVYGIPVQINDLNLRVRIGQDAITSVYPRDDLLPYENFRVHQGDTMRVGQWTIRVLGIDKEGHHPHYVPAPDDIAVTALLEVSNADTTYLAEPLFYIRGKTPGQLKAYLPEAGLHIRFENIHPQTEEFDFLIASAPIPEIPIEIAGGVARNDIIVLQAIVFPGINLFWFGSLLMMFGLFLGMWHNRRLQKTPV